MHPHYIRLFLFFYISRCFYRLLQEGAYRANSEKHLLRRKWEQKDLLFPVIITGTGVSLILINAIPAYMSIDTNSITLLVVGPAIYYLCIFVLPEQLVLLYCKFRFESFNFDKEGNLHPTDVLIEDDEDEIQR